MDALNFDLFLVRFTRNMWIPYECPSGKDTYPFDPVGRFLPGFVRKDTPEGLRHLKMNIILLKINKNNKYGNQTIL
jgi:hypothetical protein